MLKGKRRKRFRLFNNGGSKKPVRSDGKIGSKCGEWTDLFGRKMIAFNYSDNGSSHCEQGLECNEKNRCVDEASQPLTTSSKAHLSALKHMENMRTKKESHSNPLRTSQGMYNVVGNRGSRGSSQGLTVNPSVEEIYHGPDENPNLHQDRIYTSMRRLTSKNNLVPPPRPPSSSKPNTKILKKPPEEIYEQLYEHPKQFITQNLKQTLANNHIYSIPKPKPKSITRSLSRKVKRSVSSQKKKSVLTQPKARMRPYSHRKKICKDKSREDCLIKHARDCLFTNGKCKPRNPSVPKKSAITKKLTKELAATKKAKASGKRKTKQRKKRKQKKQTKKKSPVREGLIVHN